MKKMSAVRFLSLYSMVFACSLGSVQPTLATNDSGGKVAQLPEIDIPYSKYVLSNGLTLLVHEDRKTPIVAVNIYYHVGSKDEKPGLTGFAHLFEHLMFTGSENHNDEYYRPFESAGATKMNGTTWFDRTNYFANVPTAALDMALWMESDRMGHLLGVIDQSKLDEQRGVVQNEKRQGENQPYGKVGDVIAANTYPPGHPYSWTTIGSMEDLNAASLEDAKEWFRTWYGAANATLTIAGDVNAEEVKQKVERYFGDIPAGPGLRRQQQWIAKMSGEKRALMQDRVPQAQIRKVWNVPGYASKDAQLLHLAAQVLGGGNNSRLYRRLVHADQVATGTSASVWPFELGGQFKISVTVQPGGDIKAVEAALDEELANFLRSGPTVDELERRKTSSYADFVRGTERIDGFGGKSTVLAESQIYGGSPDFYKKQLQWMRAATAADVQRAARQWLSDGVFVLEVHPVPEYTTTNSLMDRTKLPDIGAPAELNLPPLQRATLSNGLKLVLAERHSAPVVQFQMMLETGSIADAVATPGTSGLMMAMLDQGTTTRDAMQIAARAEALGAQFVTNTRREISFVGLNALTARLRESLELYSDILLNATFPENDLRRIKAKEVAQILQDKADSGGIAARLLPAFVYGESHPYAVSAMVDESDVAAIDAAQLRAFYKRWVRPDNATLLVVGDTTMAQVRPLLEQHFARWKAPADPLPSIDVAHVERQPKPRVFLVDLPGAEQSTIVAGYVGPKRLDPEFVAMRTFNTLLGGSFTSRINMNLREDKHWSYGASTRLSESRGQGLFSVNAPVQGDKTAAAIEEILKELQDVIGRRKPAAEEIKAAKDTQVLKLPGDNETARELASSYSTVLTYGLADNYWNDHVRVINGLTAGDLQMAATKLIDPNALTWVVVGDLSKIEASVRALNLGNVQVIDAEGKILR